MDKNLATVAEDMCLLPLVPLTHTFALDPFSMSSITRNVQMTGKEVCQQTTVMQYKQTTDMQSRASLNMLQRGLRRNSVFAPKAGNAPQAVTRHIHRIAANQICIAMSAEPAYSEVMVAILS